MKLIVLIASVGITYLVFEKMWIAAAVCTVALLVFILISVIKDCIKAIED